MRILGLTLVCVFLTGCFSIEEESNLCKYTKDTEVPLELLHQEFIRPFVAIDIRDKKLNEFLVYQFSWRTNGQSQANVFLEESSLLANIEKKNDPAGIEYLFIKGTKRVMSDGSIDETQVDLPPIFIPAEGTDIEPLSKIIRKPKFKPSSTDQSVNKESCLKNQISGQSMHNLVIGNKLIKAPQLVQERGCPGLVNCEISARTLSFKQVDVDENDPTKISVIHHTFTISSEIPFLSEFNSIFWSEWGPSSITYNGLIDHCMEFWTEIEGSKILYKECQYLVDYQN